MVVSNVNDKGIFVGKRIHLRMAQNKEKFQHFFQKEIYIERCGYAIIATITVII